MTDYYIRNLELSELRFFFKHIQQDFPVGEYPPCDILYGHLREGRQDGMVFCSGGQDLAYSICGASTDYVLLSLLAVLPGFRGQGAGTAFLETLRDKYSHKQAIIGEVERPELASTSEEAKRRQKRIRFYEKAGYYLVPGIEYSIWDIPMHLLALPLSAAQDTINENIPTIMYQVYVQLMGTGYMHKMILNRRPDREDRKSV
ncbi:MAG: GNAT family N-acetyltransferase [Syntrophomonadaceae bacterium]|nr:GNAT family N-acetyltransferase [Syntrophomonadaceae bacterium]